MMESTEKITSRDNSRLVSARKVRDGKDRSRIFIEGRRLAQEVLRSEIDIEDCLVSDEFDGHDLINAIRDRTDHISIVVARIFKTIADTSEPQGIILIARRPNPPIFDLKAAKLPLVVFLHEINNPSNLGATLRTAEAAGTAGVIVSRNSSDVFSPKAIRAAMGSSFRLRIWENATFNEVIDWARERELKTTAADISANTFYTEIDWREPRLLMFGSEAHGLSLEQIASVDEKLLIPMDNGVESLNLGVSAGIILYEAKRQADA